MLAFVGQCLHAQEKLLPVLHFREVKGRPSAVVWSDVARDSFGFVWIGTVNGLERYDGYGVAQYRHAEHDSFSISSNIIRSLFCDSKNRLWIATEYTGLSLYDPSRDRFLNTPLPPAGAGNGDMRFPRRFLEDRSGAGRKLGSTLLRGILSARA